MLTNQKYKEGWFIASEHMMGIIVSVEQSDIEETDIAYWVRPVGDNKNNVITPIIYQSDVEYYKIPAFEDNSRMREMIEHLVIALIDSGNCLARGGLDSAEPIMKDIEQIFINLKWMDQDGSLTDLAPDWVGEMFTENM